MKRKYLFILLGFLIAVTCTKCLGDSIFDKKYSHEWLVRNFHENETGFADAVALFKAGISKTNQKDLSFGLGNWGTVNLFIYPTVIDPANKIIGGEGLKIGSPELDSILAMLKWDNETVKRLREKLAQTNCDWIRKIDNGHHVIEIYPNQTGWGAFSYAIFDEPIPDSPNQGYGRPLSDTGFGRKVELNYTSAL
ncbi:MAG TPA: hypothetical protein VG101_05570 [Puia sp.]|jgi:hypothetical protein|nr:hypothetical protein [Puia sp.]